MNFQETSNLCHSLDPGILKGFLSLYSQAVLEGLGVHGGLVYMLVIMSLDRRFLDHFKHTKQAHIFMFMQRTYFQVTRFFRNIYEKSALVEIGKISTERAARNERKKLAFII